VKLIRRWTFTTTSLGAGTAIVGLLDTSATTSSGSGVYAITQGSVINGNNPNYAIAYVGADLTVTTAPQTIGGGRYRYRQPAQPVHSAAGAAEPTQPHDTVRTAPGGTVQIAFTPPPTPPAPSPAADERYEHACDRCCPCLADPGQGPRHQQRPDIPADQPVRSEPVLGLQGARLRRQGRFWRPSCHDCAGRGSRTRGRRYDRRVLEWDVRGLDAAENG